MSYDVFISYEISDSSLAYELAAALSRNGVTYYLDCVSSSVMLSGYVKGLFTDCRLFVPLVSTRYLQEGYARTLLSYAVGMNKAILSCNTDECLLPDDFAGYTPDENRIDVRGCDIESIVQDEVLRLLNQSEDKGVAEASQGFLMPQTEEEACVPDSALESYSEPSPLIIDEEKKLLLAELLHMLRVHKEAEEGAIQYIKPEPQQRIFEDCKPSREMEETEKTLGQKVWNIITYPFRFVIVLFLLAFSKNPLVVIILVITIIIECSSPNNTAESTDSPRQEYTYEQIEKGKRLNALASDYYYGRNRVEKDRVKALEYYKQAAELGNVEAIHNVGMCAKLGMGCQKDSASASYYFYKAAQENYERGFEELKALAEAGVSEAQNRLGICYEQGYATKVIEKNAAYWYHQAAQQGNLYAQYNLGLCYYYGRGVKQNSYEALKWFRLSSQQGHEKAAEMVSKIVNAR